MRLLTLNTDAEVVAFLTRFDNEIKALKEEILRMCWYMRGGLTYDDAIMLSQSERSIIADIIKSNLETTKETRLPFF
jgi:hypothetical protein